MGITLVEPEAVKTVALEMLLDAGVLVTFYTACVGVVMDDARTAYPRHHHGEQERPRGHSCQDCH